MTDEFPSRSPIDGGVLDSLRDRARTHPLVACFEPERSNEAIVALRLVFDSDRYPETVAEATLTIRWFENGEYSFHYRERRGEGSSGTWQCRWTSTRTHTRRMPIFTVRPTPTPVTSSTIRSK